MSNFLSLIKSRLESGTQLEALGEPGWVRAALAQASQPAAAPGAVRAVGAVQAPSSGRTGEELSRTFWEAGMLDSPLPNGFYSITPNEDMRSRFAAFPSLASLEATPRGLSGDVLLLDRQQDVQLGRLAHLAHHVLQATSKVPGQEVQLQRLAEIVADFYGGAMSEAISQRSSATSGALEANHWRPRSDSAPAVVLLAELERGACRPRALLFKHLCDELGFHSRLIMGFQMEAVPLSPLAGVRPNEHLSSVVSLERGGEVLVDLLKKPGLLRPVSPRSLLTYHVGHAGDSEGMEYESGDSGPNSPLYAIAQGTDSPDHEVLDSPRLRLHRQRMAAQQAQAAAAYGLTLSPDAKLPAGEAPPTRSNPNGVEDAEASRPPWRCQGSPSPSEPGPRGRGQDTERHVLSSPEQRPQPHRRTRTSALEASSLPTSPEISRDLRRRVHSEEGSLPSSPELSQRIYPASMLGSARRFLLDEAENGTLSPEPVYAHPPPFARRRSRKKSVDIDDGASHGSLTSPDRPPRVLTRVATHAGPWDLSAASAKWQGGSPTHAKGDERRPNSGGSPAQSSASELARHLVRQRSSESAVPPRPQRTPSPTSADRRATRRSVPQVTDDVVRAVRAMNESLRTGRRRSDSVVKEPPSATGTASSTSGTTRTADAVRTGGRPPTGIQGHGGGPRRLGWANGQEVPGTERCPWCRRECTPGSPPPMVEESFLHRLDRLGIDYRPASALCGGIDCLPFFWPSSARAFLRGASVEQMVPHFAGRRASSSHPSSQVLPAPLSPHGGPVSAELERGAPAGSQAAAAAGRALQSASELASMLEQRQLLPFPEWHIDFAEIKLGIRVGVGSFGEVFRGIWRGTEVAVKLLLEQDLSPDNMDDFCNEISLLSRLRHPNVILFLGACIKAPHLSMVTEYMHMGSLYRLIHTSGQGPRLSLRRRLKMLRDICRGMMCIQRMNIVHRDLKSANCLVDKHWAVKICDFGLSRLAADAGQPGAAAVGTPEWMAPELLRSEAATFKCDVFSFGVIVWELSTLRRPWEGLKPQQVVAAVATQRARLPPPPGVLGKLVADCFAELPASRPSWEECLARLHESEFLQDLDE